MATEKRLIDLDETRNELQNEIWWTDSEKIISALDKAKTWYEDGAIIEARDLLLEIADAIDKFESEQEW